MKYRPHRGSYKDAISELKEIEPTLESLLTAIKEAYSPFEIPFNKEDLIIDPNGVYDDREPWKDLCHIVWVDRKDGGVLGFINKKELND